MKLKDPKAMTAGEINRQLDRLDAASAKAAQVLIDTGFGHETMNETMQRAKGGATDAATLDYVNAVGRRLVLRVEMECRYGPGCPARLPTKGFGPRIKT